MEESDEDSEGSVDMEYVDRAGSSSGSSDWLHGHWHSLGTAYNNVTELSISTLILSSDSESVVFSRV